MKGRVLSWKKKGKYYQFHHNKHSKYLENYSISPSLPPFNIFYVDSHSESTITPNLPILLLIHGYPTSSWDWYFTWDELTAEKRWRVIAIDMLGFGFSDKPSSRSIYYNSISLQARIIRSFLLELQKKNQNPNEPLKINIIAHDYGDSVAQELLYLYLNESPNNQEEDGEISNYEISSVYLLNGGIMPGSHKPLLIQKLMAKAYIGAFISLFVNQRSFTRNFSSIFGVKPSDTELFEFWSILLQNRGKRVQSCLMQYMNERKRNKQRWESVLLHSIPPVTLIKQNPQQIVKSVPMQFLDGPFDPISGYHLAKEVIKFVDDDLKSEKEKLVVILPSKIGHYPHTEAPSLFLQHYFAFVAHHHLLD